MAHKLLLLCGILLACLASSSCQTNTDQHIENEYESILVVPDTAIYQLVKYLVRNPVIKWEQGDSIAPFGYGRIMFDRLHPGHYTGPDLQNGDITGLYIDGILSAGDTLFYHSQIKGSKDFELKPERLPDCIIIPTDSLLVIRSRGRNMQHWIYQKYGHSIYGVSMPLFSKDYNVVTLTFNHWCGELCADDFTVIMRRHKKQWYLVKILSTAQS